MDKYLLEILKQINTIIIPGLGALTITNAETGEIMFMSYLKHDDGKLAAYISEKEGMDENEAKNLIAKYVREILAELDKGEEYTMYKFGAFFKSNDEVDFKNWEQLNSSKENTYIPPVQVEEEKEIKKEEKEEIISKEKSEEKPPLKEKKEKVTPIDVDKKTAIPIDKKEEMSSTQDKLNQLKKESKEEKPKKKKSIGFWIGIFLLALLLGGGTYFGLNYDTLKEHIPFLAQEEKTYDTDKIGQDEFETLTDEEEGDFENAVQEIEEESENIQNEEASLTENEMVIAEQSFEETEETEEQVETEESTPQKNNFPTGNFHIIAGAFSSVENANRLVQKLKEEGYTAEMKTGVKLHKVSIQSFSTLSEANSALNAIQENYPHAWVDKW